MAFEQSKLVHYQTPAAPWVERSTSLARQDTPAIERCPNLSHAQCGETLAGLNDCIGKATCHAGIAVQSGNLHTFAMQVTSLRSFFSNNNFKLSSMAVGQIRKQSIVISSATPGMPPGQHRTSHGFRHWQSS
jgi:hypothetical protein